MTVYLIFIFYTFYIIVYISLTFCNSFFNIKYSMNEKIDTRKMQWTEQVDGFFLAAQRSNITTSIDTRPQHNLRQD